MAPATGASAGLPFSLVPLSTAPVVVAAAAPLACGDGGDGSPRSSGLENKHLMVLTTASVGVPKQKGAAQHQFGPGKVAAGGWKIEIRVRGRPRVRHCSTSTRLNNETISGGSTLAVYSESCRTAPRNKRIFYRYRCTARADLPQEINFTRPARLSLPFFPPSSLHSQPCGEIRQTRILFVPNKSKRSAYIAYAHVDVR